jgi:hypothetical protein
MEVRLFGELEALTDGVPVPVRGAKQRALQAQIDQLRRTLGPAAAYCYSGVAARPDRSSLSAQSRAAAWVSLARALGSASLQLTK